MKRSLLVLGILVIAVVLMAGCTVQPTTNNTSTPTPTPTPMANVTTSATTPMANVTPGNMTMNQTPMIAITQPANNATVTGPNVTVMVNVQNFSLVNKLGQANVAGQGHIHYFLDYPPITTPGKPAIPPNTTTVSWAATANTSYTFTNVSSGMHNVSVELVNNDHTSLQPPVTNTTTFTVT